MIDPAATEAQFESPVFDSSPASELAMTAIIITFNHERYLRQALDSVLMQETSFVFEIIVSEDQSTDSTRDILIEYQENYPGRIVTILSDINLNNNEVVSRAVRSARGKYIAFLDGDDYWISRDKLQRQFDFMEAHPDSALTFHDAARVTEDGEVIRIMSGPRGRSTIEDLIQGNFITSCSCVTRRSTIASTPDWMRTLASGDWPSHLLAARSGFIDHVDGLMAHYRIHGDAAWSTTPLVEQWVRTLSMLFDLEEHLGEEYRAAFARSRRNVVDQIQASIPDVIAAASDTPSTIAPSSDPVERLRIAEWNAREAKVRAWESSVRIRELEVQLRDAGMQAADRDAAARRAADAEAERDSVKRGIESAEARIREVEAVAEAAGRVAENRLRDMMARAERAEEISRLTERMRLEAEQRVREAADLRLREISEIRVAAATEVETRLREAETRSRESLVSAEEGFKREQMRLRMREKRTIFVLSATILLLMGFALWMQLS
jgi:hypothetical protein